MSKKPFPSKDVINEWMEDTTKTLQIRVADSDSNWTDCRHQVPVLSDQFEYRIVDDPEPLNIKFPEIVTAKWQYFAMDKTGEWYLYTHKPRRGRVSWKCIGGNATCISGTINTPMVPGGRWKETLTKRP